MRATIEVLYIDDYELDRELVRDVLEKEHGGFRVTQAANKEEFLAALQNGSFDAILSDFNIAGFEGLEVIETIRQKNLNIPVIIVTGTGSEEIAVQAMRMGASDYVIKRPNHIRRLPLTILSSIEREKLKERHEEAAIALNKSENRLRHLIQNIPIALLVYNAELEIVESNVEARRLLNISAEQLENRKLSTPVKSLFDENGAPLPLDGYPANQAFLRNRPILNKVVGFEGQKKGDMTWLLVNAVPEFVDSDQIAGVVVSFIDISQEKATQEALRVSQERLELAQEASNDGLWDWFLPTGKVYFNSQYYTMLGYQPYEFVPSYQTWSDLLHPDEREVIEKKILDHLQTRDDAFEVEFRMREKSGAWRWILGKGKVFERDQAGKALRATGTHTDIDNLKKVQSELFQSKEKYWSLLNNIELGISMINPQMQILEANSWMKKWYPRIADSPQSYCYETTNDPPHHKPCSDCPVLRTFQDGLMHESLIERHLDGKKNIFRVISSPVHDAQDKVVFVIRILEDVTEKRRLEIQSRQSQKMESLGTLAGGIAHDFNNILTAIIGFAELADDQAEEESSLKEDLQEILVAGRRAKDLVTQILTFSSTTEQDYQPIDFVPILKESLRLLKSVLPASIEIRNNLYIKSGVVRSDPTQLHQIIVNLCTNSAHAMERDGGVMDISLNTISIVEENKYIYPQIDAGEYLCFSISDCGQGIAPEIQEKIFEPYFTTKEEGKGSGLGLSVVHGLVRMHGGHITVYSEVGKGTTFNVYLPLAKDAARTAKKSKVASPSGGDERILLIDDELPILKMQSQTLEKLGYTVSAFSDGLEALHVFQKEPHAFDLVLTDMTMPKITGDKLLHELKKIRRDIPVILCSGFSARINMTKKVELPVDAFLIKPVERSTMAETIRKILDKKQCQ